MQSLEILTAASGSLYLLTTTAVGVRLLVLAKRNGTLPELLLGLSLLLGGTLSAPLEVASGQVFAVPSPEAGATMAIAKLIGAVGIALYSYFIWRVFRPDSRIATASFWMLLGISTISIVGFAAAGSFGTGNLDFGWFCFELVGRIASPLWMIGESFAYWKRMRRRVRLDLADPVVSNRFLLWAIGASCALVMLGTSITPRVAPNNDAFLSLNLVILGIAGIASSVPYWLAFFPPSAYRRWVARSTPA